MKKVGIITMHKPLSYGSALQAYALQKKIDDLGCEAEIIDYKYPNELHTKGRNNLKYVIQLVVSYFIHAFFGFPNLRKSRKFKAFHKSFFKLSKNYRSEQDLIENKPLYDIYMTGSDQVWNANFTKNDSTFLLGFAPDESVKCSFASSFAIKQIPPEYDSLYRRLLKRYDKISVREESAVGLVKTLTGKDATMVCDPTVLLTRDEWDEIADSSTLNIAKPYLLVFMLCYSFNPYPKAREIIHSIQEQTGLTAIYLDGLKNDYKEKNAIVLKDCGPADFIQLIRNASYIITDSFHGTVFASLYNKPFTSIVKKGNTDSRIVSYLNSIGLEKFALPFDTGYASANSSSESANIDEFRNESIQQLINML